MYPLKSLKKPLPRQSLIAYAILGVLLCITSVAYFSYVHQKVRQSDPATYFYAGLRIAEIGRPSFCDDYNKLVEPYFTLLGLKVRDRKGDDFISNSKGSHYLPGHLFRQWIGAEQVQ